GFWVQRFQCFPWKGINFYLKDRLSIPVSTLQNLANLPMVTKPLYGLLSNVVAIYG
ncbi:putative folate-biopterin transporter 7, partial [Cocos nucifera]